MSCWADGKNEIWLRICEKYGGNPEAFDWGTWGLFEWSMGKTWPTLSTITKARGYGWTRYDDTYTTWIETFRAFESGGVLPSRQRLLEGQKRGKSVQSVQSVLSSAKTCF
jgi:hypothetical protein